MLLINDQNERHSEYNKFESYLKRIKIKQDTKLTNNNTNLNITDLVYFHIRVYVDNFDQSHLRLHTGKQVVKLCFVNDFEKTLKQQTGDKKEEELILFELRFNKLLSGLEEKIDHEHIEANLDDETRILAINIPLC